MPMVASGAVTPITAKTRFHCSRRGPSVSRQHDRRHAQHIGEVVHAWNRAHAGLFALFQRVAADGDYALALGVWHTVPSDSTQRQMLEAAARAKLGKRRSYLNGVVWGCRVLNELGTLRNDAAHAEMLFYYTELVPGLSTKPGSAERLAQRPLSTHWRQLVGDLNAVTDYLRHLDFSLWMGMPRPLARRPRLQVAVYRSALTRLRVRRAKKAKRLPHATSSELRSRQDSGM